MHARRVLDRQIQHRVEGGDGHLPAGGLGHALLGGIRQGHLGLELVVVGNQALVVEIFGIACMGGDADLRLDGHGQELFGQEYVDERQFGLLGHILKGDGLVHPAAFDTQFGHLESRDEGKTGKKGLGEGQVPFDHRFVGGGFLVALDAGDRALGAHLVSFHPHIRLFLETGVAVLGRGLGKQVGPGAAVGRLGGMAVCDRLPHQAVVGYGQGHGLVQDKGYVRRFGGQGRERAGASRQNENRQQADDISFQIKHAPPP